MLKHIKNRTKKTPKFINIKGAINIGEYRFESVTVKQPNNKKNDSLKTQ